MITRITRPMAQARLGDVPREKVFWARDGRVLKNLAELERALSEMSDDTYQYHTNDTKRDFAHWVSEVVGDDKLGRDLEKSPTREEAARHVAARVSWLKGKL